MTVANFIPAGTTVTMKDGSVLVAREWGEEQEAIVMALLARHKNGCATTTVATALGRGVPETRHYLSQLMDRGKVENVGSGTARPMWAPLHTTVDDFLVVDAHKPRILKYLKGRREMPGRIAADLGLPRDEVTETCKAMMLAGELVGTRVGAAFVYDLDIREKTRMVEPERIAREIPKSPEALFRESLAIAHARSPEPVLKSKSSQYVARTPRAPADWVCLPDLARETKTSRDTVVAWLNSKGHEATTYLGTNGRVGKFVGPEVAAAYREHTEARKHRLTLKQAAKKAGVGEGHLRGLVNRRRIPHEGKGKDALIDVRKVDLDNLKPRVRHKRPQAVKQARETAREIIPTREGYKTAAQVTRELGIGQAAFCKWLELNDSAKKLCVREGKYLMVPQKVIEIYVERSLPPGATFAASVPENWLDIWNAVKYLGWSYCKVYKMLAAGKLVAVQCHGKLHFDPGPLDALKAELDAQLAIPDGYVNLREFCLELGGLDRSSVTSWMTRNGFSLPKYRDPERQLAVYLTPEAAEAYRAYRNKTPGGVKITPQIEAEIRALADCAPKRGKRFAPGALTPIAEHYGISTASINIVLRRPPTAAAEACTVDALALIERIWPDSPELDVNPTLLLPETPSIENSTEQAVSKRPVITLALEEQLRAELSPTERRKPGKTAEVAAKYGLSVAQVRGALSRIPANKEAV